MRQDEEHFDDRDLGLLYIAKRLKEALALEELLTAAGLDYFVEPDKYRGGIIFPSERVGAFFYVPVEALAAARTLLEQNGYEPYKAEPK